MPSYEYRCADCNESKTQTVGITDKTPSNPDCPTCKQPMTRQWGVAAVQFKGSGFASTDKR